MTKHRLPTSVRPTNYKIKLQPDLKEFTFDGNVVVDLQVKEVCNSVVVNSADIKIKAVEIQLSNNQVLSSEDIVYNAKDEIVTFNFKEELPLGDAKLNISFVGELNDKMKGFYRSKYLSSDGEEKYCGTTHFEPTGARMAFPCWDEPEIKATFEIQMIVPKNKLALSNMNISSVEECESEKLVTFNRTPVMSTYLVAFIVGEFEFVEGKTASDIPVRVYTPVGKSSQGEFGLEIAVKSMNFYEEYFNAKYPLPKLDLIALPDFPIGAMENWGLVTYVESALLYDEQETSLMGKKWVALVVAHELAHNWFGNLVTMCWWTDLWLKEGFATWCEYLCIDHICPEFSIWNDFVSRDATRALGLDSLSTSHPIEVEVGHPSELDEIFDLISYCKGAAVIRMLHTYVGADCFRNGLRTYLQEFKYSNASTDDLWEHLEKASGKPIKQVMSTWTKQMGYPVLTVTDEQSQSQRIIKLKQKKFTADGSPDANNQQWAVPVTITTGQKHTMSSLMNDPEMVIFVDDMDEKDWVKVNPGLTGFYRVCYSYSMISLLIPAISTLSAVDRLGLENDTFALSVAGVSPTTSFLELLSGYQQEREVMIWRDIASNLSYISTLLQGTGVSLDAFIAKLFRPTFERLGWDAQPGDDLSSNNLRCLLLQMLSCSGDDEVIKESKRRFASHVGGTQLIHADIRSAVYSTVMRTGDNITLKQITTLYLNTTHMEEKMRILRSLGSTSDPDLITKVLQFALSKEVRSQNTRVVFEGCSGNPTSRKMAWDSMKENWSEFQRRYSGIMLSRYIKNCTMYFSTKEELTNVTDFFASNATPSAERAVEQAKETIKLNIAWKGREIEKLAKWL